VAYLVPLQACECQVCGKRATHTLYSKAGIKLGDYCKPCGNMMRLDALATEYYEGD